MVEGSAFCTDVKVHFDGWKENTKSVLHSEWLTVASYLRAVFNSIALQTRISAGCVGIFSTDSVTELK